MKFKKYDIILVHFPFSNLKGSKVRPSLVLRPLEGNNTILCQITTKKRRISRYEVSLKKESCAGDIRFNSNIYLDMIFTLHESLIINRIGHVKDKSVIKEIEDKLGVIFN